MKPYHEPSPDTEQESPEAFHAIMRKALLKGFAIPLALLVFFAAAPAWLNHKLHEEVAKGIATSQLPLAERAERLAAFERVDFAVVCGNTPKGFEQLRARLDEAGVTGQFTRLRWGLWLSILLVVILTVSTVMIYRLNRRARQSKRDLIQAYQRAWQISVYTAMANVLLLIPLLGYGTFELTTLAASSYFPKLILLIVVGGIVALSSSIKILMHKVPLEFQVRMARAVSPEEAPALWSAVRLAADRVGTAPPDSILVGMEPNFYVTELAVNYTGGRATGRTLYLSIPLMQQGTTDEVTAIIGHELGHFRGEDTQLTREFYPLHLKVNATIQTMANAGWVGWTSVHGLLFFHGSFAQTEQAYSREREFLADRVGADLTSPLTLANALVKVHVFGAAFARRIEFGKDNPFTMRLTEYVRSELLGRPEFWKDIFKQTMPHPLDSHPSLRLRLKALDQDIDVEAAKALVSTDSETAYNLWLSGQEGLLAGVNAEAAKEAERVRTLTAKYETAEGKELLDRQFPEVRWPARPLGMWIRIGACCIGALIPVVVAIAVPEWPIRFLMLALFLVCAVPAVILWLRHHRAELVLRADSLHYSAWNRPLYFSDVANILTQTGFGSTSAIFLLKTSTSGRWKYSPVNWIPLKQVSIDLGLMRGKSQETLATILRYMARNTEQEPPVMQKA